MSARGIADPPVATAAQRGTFGLVFGDSDQYDAEVTFEECHFGGSLPLGGRRLRQERSSSTPRELVNRSLSMRQCTGNFNAACVARPLLVVGPARGLVQVSDVASGITPDAGHQPQAASFAYCLFTEGW